MTLSPHAQLLPIYDMAVESEVDRDVDKQQPQGGGRWAGPGVPREGRRPRTARGPNPQAAVGRRESPQLGGISWGSQGERRFWWDCSLGPAKNQEQGEEQGTGQDNVQLAPQKGPEQKVTFQ